MKIVLATGIYPPDIGGPATYARALAEELCKRGVEVVVVTYGDIRHQTSDSSLKSHVPSLWKVIHLPKNGGPLARWLRYAKALREHASDADGVIAFSSVSTGVPLMLARLKKPKKILRLGGDFFWERYTDRGGKKNLREFYESPPWLYWYTSIPIRGIFWGVDVLVFSTRYQEEMYEKYFKALPKHSVIENAIPEGAPKLHEKHEPFRLLFLGRLVGFKNLPALVRAIGTLREAPLRRNVTLAFVGDGPMKMCLEGLVRSLKLQGWVRFLPSTHDEEKKRYFADYDLLVLPSLTELSPNVVLEARAHGLPVLLSSETGLSERLREGMTVRQLRSEAEIVQAILEVMTNYAKVAQTAANLPLSRSWGEVAEEFLNIMRSS